MKTGDDASGHDWLKLSEIYMLLPDHKWDGFLWVKLANLDFRTGQTEITLAPNEKLLGYDIQNVGKSQFLEFYRSLISDAARLLESGQIEAVGRKGDLEADLRPIGRHIWAHADFFASSLHKGAIDFDGVRYYDIRVRRPADRRSNEKKISGRKKGNVSPASKKYEEMVIRRIGVIYKGRILRIEQRGLVAEIIKEMGGQNGQDMAPNTKRDAVIRAMSVHNQGLKATQIQKTPTCKAI